MQKGGPGGIALFLCRKPVSFSRKGEREYGQAAFRTGAGVGAGHGSGIGRGQTRRVVRPADDRARAHRRRACRDGGRRRSEEHTSELQSLMRISYAVFCLKKKK